MFVCLVAVCVVCLWTGFINVRMRLEIRSLCLQLAELEQGSHMELTVLSRQKALLTLCRAMNRVLAFRDRTHVQYEASQKQMQRNITSLAHDIRTPLTGACGYLQLAQECPEPEKQDHYLQCAGSRLKELEERLAFSEKAREAAENKLDSYMMAMEGSQQGGQKHTAKAKSGKR